MLPFRKIQLRGFGAQRLIRITHLELRSAVARCAHPAGKTANEKNRRGPACGHRCSGNLPWLKIKGGGHLALGTLDFQRVGPGRHCRYDRPVGGQFSLDLIIQPYAAPYLIRHQTQFQR